MSNKEGPDLSANHINHEESRFVRRTAEISNANRVSKPDGRLIPGQLTMCDHTQPIFIDRSERPRWHQGQRRRSIYYQCFRKYVQEVMSKFDTGPHRSSKRQWRSRQQSFAFEAAVDA